MAVKLVETEDLLEATQAEKENLDAQVGMTLDRHLAKSDSKTKADTLLSQTPC